jgi:hypothetical protein
VQIVASVGVAPVVRLASRRVQPLPFVHDTVTVDELQLNGCASYMDTPCWVSASGMRELLPFRLMGAKALCTWLSCNGSSESFKNKLRCLVYMDHDKIVHSFIH